MSRKFMFPEGNLAVPAIVHTANLSKRTFMKITDDETVDPVTTEDDFCVGTLEKASRVADDSGTLRTRFRARIDVKCSGAIAAGERVKIGTNSDGVQTFKKFDAATDDSDLSIGICWIGAGDGETGTFLVF